MIRNAATDRRRHSAVTAQSQRSRGPRGAGEAAAPGRCGRRRFPGAGRAEKVESREEMPEVTRFFGIVVRMYFRDHTPHISTPNTANTRLSLRLTRSPFSGESSRGEPWRWYSNGQPFIDRKSTRLNSSHLGISYAVFCLKKK